MSPPRSVSTEPDLQLQWEAVPREGDGLSSFSRVLLEAFHLDGTFAGRFGIAQMPGAPTFLVDLPLGRYRFVVRCADGRTVEMPEQSLTSFTETRDVTVDLPPPGK